MNPSARTIDNLGYEASQRYALDQKMLDESKTLTQGPGNLPRQASIDVKIPSYQSEWNQMFQAEKKNTSWAQFAAPFGYYDQRGCFFTYELFPSLLLQEKNNHFKEKILKYKQEQDSSDHSKKDNSYWDNLQVLEEEERKKARLLNLLNCILHLDKCMIHVQTKRAQYHKG